MKATGGQNTRCKMINPDKTLQEMTTKLDEILDWLTDSPMDNKDYNTLHKIFNKYLEIENKQQKHYYENSND